MIAYDAQLYTFLTRPENFEPFIDLSEQYAKVKQRLIDEFWMMVLEEANKMKPKDMEWSFSLEEPNSRNRKLRACHPDISDENLNAGIIYEYLDSELLLGAWFNRWNVRFKDSMPNIWEDAKVYLKINLASINDYTWNVGSGGWWFAIYKYPGLNFSQKSSLLQILPHVREPLAKTYAAQLVSAVAQLGPFLLNHAKKS